MIQDNNTRQLYNIKKYQTWITGKYCYCHSLKIYTHAYTVKILILIILIMRSVMSMVYAGQWTYQPGPGNRANCYQLIIVSTYRCTLALHSAVNFAIYAHQAKFRNVCLDWISLSIQGWASSWTINPLSSRLPWLDFWLVRPHKVSILTITLSFEHIWQHSTLFIRLLLSVGYWASKIHFCQECYVQTLNLLSSLVFVRYEHMKYWSPSYSN